MSDPRFPPSPHRPVPALQCWLAYLTALGVGVACWWSLRTTGVVASALWQAHAVTVAATLALWVFSIANGNSSIYDPYWVIAPPLIALGLRAVGEGGLAAWHPRQLVVAAALCLWAARYHVFYAWDGWRTGLDREDWRYEEMRSAPVPYWLNSLLGMHLFPTWLVFFAFAPAGLVMVEPGSQPALGAWDLVGAAAALGAVTLQLVADRQLAAYRRSKEYESGGTCREGLWNWSRHPNYFGEVLFWLSMVAFATGAGLLAQHPVLVLAGPAVMAGFFRFSAHLMDRRSLLRRPAYRTVMEQVSALVPWPPRAQ